MKNLISLLPKITRLLRPVQKDYRKKFSLTLKDWLIYHQKEIVFDKCRWMGVRAMKNPMDAWIYQEIIYEVKPEIIIEIGSKEGGSTLFLANLLDILNNGQVISIDIDRKDYKVKHPRIIPVTGDSSSEKTVNVVKKICDGKKVLAVHDGDHSRNHVLKDLALYSNLISINSYFIVEDGVMDLFKPGDGIGAFNDGPLAAIDEFLRKNSNFIADEKRERYILTYNPRGFLKRIS